MNMVDVILLWLLISAGVSFVMMDILTTPYTEISQLTDGAKAAIFLFCAIFCGVLIAALILISSVEVIV